MAGIGAVGGHPAGDFSHRPGTVVEYQVDGTVKLGLPRDIPAGSQTEDFTVSFKPKHEYSDIEDFRHAFINLWEKSADELVKKTGQSILNVVGFDTLEAIIGEKWLPEVITQQKGQVSASSGLSINIGRQSNSYSNNLLADASTIHLKIEEMYGTYMLYGLKPRTGIYRLKADASKGYPDLILTHVV